MSAGPRYSGKHLEEQVDRHEGATNFCYDIVSICPYVVVFKMIFRYAGASLSLRQQPISPFHIKYLNDIKTLELPFAKVCCYKDPMSGKPIVSGLIRRGNRFSVRIQVPKDLQEERGRSFVLNSFEPFLKWISRSVMPPPGLVSMV